MAPIVQDSGVVNDLAIAGCFGAECDWARQRLLGASERDPAAESSLTQPDRRSASTAAPEYDFSCFK